MKIVFILLIFFSALMADRDGGPYIGVGYGTSTYDDAALYNALTENSSGAATFYFGAYMNKHFSVELSYASFDAWHFHEGYQTDTNRSLGLGALSVSTLAHYAFFDDSLDFYAKFGVGEMSISGLESKGFTMLYGAGIGYRLNKYMSLKVAYDIYTFSYDQTRRYEMQIDYMYSAIEVQF